MPVKKKKKFNWLNYLKRKTYIMITNSALNLVISQLQQRRNVCLHTTRNLQTIIYIGIWHILEFKNLLMYHQLYSMKVYLYI